MNEQTTQLIEKLAGKLGTTADHLWGVLVRQAPWAALTDAIVLIVFGIVIMRIAKSIKKVDESCDEFASFKHLLAWVAIFIAGYLLAELICENAYLIVAGFVNPEYWALKQIMK